jgi:hypothetical protein
VPAVLCRFCHASEGAEKPASHRLSTAPNLRCPEVEDGAPSFRLRVAAHDVSHALGGPAGVRPYLVADMLALGVDSLAEEAL